MDERIMALISRDLVAAEGHYQAKETQYHCKLN